MRPSLVPDALIEMLRSREDEEGIQRIEPRELHSGDLVRIVEGVMVGYEGILEDKSGKERVCVLLKIANTTARVQVSSDDIEPVDIR